MKNCLLFFINFLVHFYDSNCTIVRFESKKPPFQHAISYRNEIKNLQVEKQIFKSKCNTSCCTYPPSFETIGQLFYLILIEIITLTFPGYSSSSPSMRESKDFTVPRDNLGAHLQTTALKKHKSMCVAPSVVIHRLSFNFILARLYTPKRFADQKFGLRLFFLS